MIWGFLLPGTEPNPHFTRTFRPPAVRGERPHRIRRTSGRLPFRIEAALRHPSPHHIDVNASLPLNVQGTQAVDDVVRCLPGDISKDDITSRANGGPRNTARLLTAGSFDRASITASLVAAGDQILKCSIRSVCTR